MASPRVARGTQSNRHARTSSSKRGFDYRWQKARETYLRNNPLCIDHKQRGKIVAATVVDHIVPHRLSDAIDSGDEQRIAEARERFWDSDNWQPLCKHCHDSRKQRLERSGRVQGCDANGLPLDPHHFWATHPGGGSNL